MLKALCFLGTGPQGGRYTPTTYVKHDGSDESDETDLFPVAVSQLYNPEKIVVFVTPQVKEGDYLDPLKEKLGCKLEEKELPDLLDRGNSEKDLWQIFDTYQKSVDKEDKIILDITHGFRSLPMLAFPVVAYLRQVKQVTLEHILYAPYDARPESQGKNTPIFDLTPFVTLLDWMNAVNIFQSTGDARPIAELNIHNDISNALTKLSESLLTNRTIEVQEAAFEFNGLRIDDLITEQDQGNQAPFRMLIEQLKENYQGMAVNAPRNNPEQSINKQFEQIKWYIDNQHYFQAITLIREWLVSWQYIQWRRRTMNGWLRWHGHRRPIEDAFNDYDSEAPDPDDDAWDLWEVCAELRNDLAHCGMRTDPLPRLAEAAIDAINQLFRDLEIFAKNKGVIS